MYLIDQNIALLLCTYEIVDIMKKIYCGCIRCIKFYLLHDKAADKSEKGVTANFEHLTFEPKYANDDQVDIEAVKDQVYYRKGLVYGQFLNFLNYFAELGGFEALVDALKIGNASVDERMPLEVMSLLVQPFKQCNTVFEAGFSQKFVGQVREILVQRFSSMTEKELKEIDKETVSGVLFNMKDFFTLAMTDVETAELVEKTQLSMALRFLKSTYLEKRLKGISDIKAIIERVEHAMTRKNALTKMNAEFDTIGTKSLRPMKFITPDFLKQWLVDSNILSIVFGENTHLEIVKRSSCILKFLAKLGALPEDAVDLVWKCQLGKHQEMVRVVYSTIQDLVPSIEVRFVDMFYTRIQQVPQSAFDDKFLDFLRDFTQKALENYFEAKSKEMQLAEQVAAVFEQ